LVYFMVMTIPVSHISAQDQPVKKPYKLTHHMSPGEKAMFHLVGKDYKATDPPPGEVHNVAEFEKMEGVLVGYPGDFGISYQVIAAMSEETMVTTIVENNNQLTYVTNQYQSNGVNMANANFLVKPLDSYWTRDYGPWYIRYGDDHVGIVDFVYNRPNRPNDNMVPQHMADFLGIEWFGMNLIHTGGNYMTDGYGISSSTDLVWEENPTLSHDEIDQLVQDYLGIDTYHVVDDPNNTYIDHIDCWGKFLDVDKVLIREVPESHPQYDEIEATVAYYAGQISSWGNPFQVYRVWTPNDQPYTNSLILNNRVFVPITGSQWDDEAIASYEEAMPGYEILGFTGSWESTDALHCRTKGIADRNMLYIEHYPLLGIQPVLDEYAIEAKITAYSGAAINYGDVKVNYSINGGTMQEITMNYEGDKIYTAAIPASDPGSEIAYFITGQDADGNQANHPIIGEFDPHIFFIGEELFPNIAVDVTSIEAMATTGSQTTENFTITNAGEIDLNYNIYWNTAIYEDFNYAVDDSPAPTSWEFNTFTELGWTTIDVDDSGEIAMINIDYQWQTDQYAYESTFYIESPQGTDAIIASGNNTGNYSISLDDFNGEEMTGTWKMWIEDSYGDGGHKASNIEVTVTKSVDIAQWLEVVPAEGTVIPGDQQIIEVTCDASELPVGEYDGIMMVYSNDPDQETIEIPVHFTVDVASGLSENDLSENRVNNYPNPFSGNTYFDVNVLNTCLVTFDIYNLQGQKIQSLVNEVLESGRYKFTWNGENSIGQKVKVGVYFYRLKIDNFEKTGKLILVE
ncbi:MAG: agmatine deiminase family protein, partial [Bacteroidales bacterium]|nr:agmatine deiminase family protein [Bacteroidales bacterium]